MTRILALSILFCFLIFSPVCATLLTTNDLVNPNVIDFSQFVGDEHTAFGTPIQIGDLVGADVTVSGTPSDGTNGAWLYNSTWGLGNNGYWDSGRSGFAGYAWGDTVGTVMFSFNDSPVSAVGAFINDAPGYGDLIISAYDAGMTLLESYDIWSLAPISTTGMTNEGAFRGISLDSALISYFAVTGYVPVVDDLAFTGSAPVPEPATFILLGSGLAGLAFYRRKRK